MLCLGSREHHFPVQGHNLMYIQWRHLTEQNRLNRVTDIYLQLNIYLQGELGCSRQKQNPAV